VNRNSERIPRPARAGLQLAAGFFNFFKMFSEHFCTDVDNLTNYFHKKQRKKFNALRVIVNGLCLILRNK